MRKVKALLLIVFIFSQPGRCVNVSSVPEEVVWFDMDQVGSVVPHVFSVIDYTDHLVTTRKQSSVTVENLALYMTQSFFKYMWTVDDMWITLRCFSTPMFNS